MSFPAGKRSDCFFSTLPMMRAIGAGDQVAHSTAAVGGDESMNAK